MNKQFVSPFCFPLIALIAGIFWQHCVPYTPTTASTLICLTITFIFLTKLWVYQQLFIPTAFFLGGTLLLHFQQVEHTEKLHFLKNKTFNAHGIIVDEEIKENCPCKFVIKIEVNTITTKENSTPIPQHFNLLAYCQKKPAVQVGDKIIFYNIQLKPNNESTTLTNAPTLDEYLAKENILAVIFCQDPAIDLIQRPSFSYARYLAQKRNTVCRQLQYKLSKKTFTLFASIFLGTKTFKPIDSTKEAFGFWGLAHYLARSGLHIVLLIFAWSLLLNMIPIPFWQKRLLLLIITMLYTALSWSSISFIRAFGVFIIYEIGKVWLQQLNFLHVLTMVCMMILITNPLQLFFLDFQLSFALTFALVLTPVIFYKSFERKEEKP